MNSILKPLLLQSFRTGGLYLLIIALSLAISATTALKFSNSQVQNAVALQAAEMLGADLVMSDNNPIQTKWLQQAQKLNLQQAAVTVFGSMAHTQDQFVMVNVKAVDEHFPLRGKLDIQPTAENILAALEDTHVLHWHGDTFDLPDHATLLASSDIYPHQAFAIGKQILALQFHLEVSQHSFEKWLIGHTCEIRHANLSIPQLRQDNLLYAAQLENQAQKIIQRFLENLSH